MFRVRFTGVNATKNAMTSALRSEVTRLSNELYTEIKQRTPVDTGRARAGWNQRVQTNGFTISNQVDYIGVLDKGRHMTGRGMRGSKQAPKGIVGPSLDSIKRKN
jgi:hypothetical protein